MTPTAAYETDLMFRIFQALNNRQRTNDWIKSAPYSITPYPKKIVVDSMHTNQVFDELISVGHTAKSAREWMDEWICFLEWLV